MKKLLTIFVLSAIAFQAFAQQSAVSVSGFVRDSQSGETLIGAVVFDASKGNGAVSNNFGYYSLRSSTGKVSLTISSLGYNEKTVTLDIQKDTTINFLLDFQAQSLAGAVVTAQHSEIGVRGTQMSAIEVPINQIRAVPALGGEVDLIKALQLLPGVQGGTEGAAGMYVRGGGPDENLLLLDGVPVYNVNHLMGFFSVFNADAIKNVTMYKGSFPARFGSRLSSVIDIRTKDGNDQEIHGAASVGVVAAKFNVEGPIVKGKTTFNISARRTYYDLITAPAINAALKSEGEDGKAMVGYYFYDINAKFTHRFSDKDKLFLSFYSGDDATYVNYKIKDNGTDYKDITKIGLDWKWGNMVGALRWNHVFSPKLFMNAAVNYTRYRHMLDVGAEEETIYNTVGVNSKERMDMNLDYNSGISDKSAQVEFEYLPAPGHDIKFGGDITAHAFNPSVTSQKIKVESMGEKLQQDTTFGDKKIYSTELALYAEDNWSVNDWLKLNIGARYSMYAVSGKSYHSLEPRFSARALITDDLSVKASYSEMSQFVHMLSNSSLSLPTDLWVPVTQRIKPMRSKQAAAGLFYSYDVFDFSVEGYYKDMQNVLEYRDGASFLGSAAGWEDMVAMGHGWSYGAEFLVQKKVGKVSGWIGYTISRSWRQFDREGNVINYGVKFPAKYDRIHDLSATMSYTPQDKVNFSFTVVYGSGTTGSLPLEYVMTPEYGRQSWYSDSRRRQYLEGRNNYRLPSYFRADLGVNFPKHLRRGERTISLNVYNVTNHKNPFLVYATSQYLKQVSIFPIMPSLSYIYEF